MTYSLNLCNHASINLNYLLYLEKINNSDNEIFISNMRIPITSDYKNGFIDNEMFSIELEKIWSKIIQNFVVLTNRIINGDLMEWDRINYKNKDELYKTLFKQNQKGIVALQDTWKEFEQIWYMSPAELSFKMDLNSGPYVELVGKAIDKISDEYNLNSNQNYSIQALMCKPCCIETNKVSKYFLYYWPNGHNTDLKLASKMTESLYNLIISNNK